MASDDKKKHPLQHLLAGGAAGLVESSVCHPLDTIKTRMQLRRQTATVEKVVVKMRDSMMEPALRLQHSLQDPVLRTATGGGHEPGIRFTGPTKLTNVTMHPHTVQAPLGPIGTARRIVEREGFFALYKVSGLSCDGPDFVFSSHTFTHFADKRD